uniref:uncharacterized protein LOC108950198 isoform X2 n=1 Tax=Ciona intestinalis TaxID=7719 RepID=UPI000EF44B23|nr:uncharacterized protein LOC108950198 isoform X2 [Ciona intestinalis]|eukprot:XP_026693831.1 uncharacterized protein LOC108950198 isoform X2 [Ciona intestinalis]
MQCLRKFFECFKKLISFHCFSPVVIPNDLESLKNWKHKIPNQPVLFQCNFIKPNKKRSSCSCKDYIAYVPFSQLPVRSQILAAFNRCEDAVKRRKTFKLAITVVCGINESNHESESPILSERKRKIPRKLKIVITSKPTSLHPFRLSKFKANTSSCDVTVNICDDISVTDISDMDVTINMFFATKNASNQRRNAQDNNIGKILYKYTHTSLKILKK